MNSEDDVVQVNGLHNLSAVNDSKSWGSPASRITNFQQHGEDDNGSIRRRYSLYDYGMGSSVRSFRTTQESHTDTASFGERDIRDPPGYFYRA